MHLRPIAQALLLAPLLPLAAIAGTSPAAPTSHATLPPLREQQAQGGYLYTSGNFVFFCPLRADMAAMEPIARLFENTCNACTALPLNFACSNGVYQVRIFRNREHFLDTIGQQYAKAPGVYMQGCILLPAETLGLEAVGDRLRKAPGREADTDTILHELAHLLTLRDATWDTPTWLGEGIAEYVRLAADAEGNFDFAGVKEELAPYITTGRRLGAELSAPPLEQFMNQSRMEFQQAQGKAGHFNYAFATLLTYYFLHLDGKGDAAPITAWMQHLQSTPKATAHLRYNLPANPTPEQVAAERQRLMQEVLATREIYYYEPLLQGRSWPELEKEISHKVEESLGIRVNFPGTPR